VVLDTGQLARVVSEHAHGLDAQITQNLDTESVLALVGAEAEPLVGFDRIVALILQGVRADLVREADAAPFLIEIQNDAAAFGGDPLHRRVQLGAAVAACGVKHIAGQTRRVDAHEHTFAVADFAEHEGDVRLPVRSIVVRMNLEIAELRRQLRRGDGADSRLPERGLDACTNRCKHAHGQR